jgi:predicted AAA+ superfamily ATPase
VFVVPPWFENLGKRLRRAPKVYIADSGLACHLLGIETAAELARSPFAGAILEGFVAAEMAKAQVARGARRELYYFRDQAGLEVDFVLPRRGGGMRLVEVKSSATPRPEMARPMRVLADAWRALPTSRGAVEMVLVHGASKSTPRLRTLAPGAQAISWPEFVEEFEP